MIVDDIVETLRNGITKEHPVRAYYHQGIDAVLSCDAWQNDLDAVGEHAINTGLLNRDGLENFKSTFSKKDQYNEKAFYAVKDMLLNIPYETFVINTADGLNIEEPDMSSAHTIMAAIKEGLLELPFEQCMFQISLSDTFIDGFDLVDTPTAVLYAVNIGDAFHLACFLVYKAKGTMPTTISFASHNSMLAAFNRSDIDLDSLPQSMTLSLFYYAMMAINTDGLLVEKVGISPKLNKKRRGKGKHELKDYHVVKLDKNRRRVEADRLGVATNSVRLHVRRGHIRNLSDGRKTWVRSCLVGSADNGVVKKHYEVKKK